LYILSNIIRVIKSRIIRWEGYVTKMEEGGMFLKFSLLRPKRRWEDNILMDLKE